MAIVRAYSQELNPEEPHEITFTGSQTLKDQLDKVRNDLPVITVIVEDPVKKYPRMT